MVSAIPNMPTPVVSSGTSGVKIADPDIILFDEEAVPIELMTDLIFENIGGQEIISIARTDLVNGQNVIYSPIKNLSQTYLRYNPQNILSIQETSDSVFNSFPIKLASHIPQVGNGPQGQNVYIDPLTGNVVVEAVNLRQDYLIEIQIANSVTTLNDTIYIEGAS